MSSSSSTADTTIRLYNKDEVELIPEPILGRGASCVVQLGRLLSTAEEQQQQTQDSSPFQGLVALKQVDRGGETDAHGTESLPLRRLQHEQSILAQLDHPGVSRLLGHMETSNNPVSVLSLYPYDHLGRHLLHHARRLLPRTTVKVYMAELVAALGHIHSRGFVHRDLSARNILMDEKGHLVISDFGMAARMDCLNGHTTSEADQLGIPSLTEGSVLYLAPERISDQGPDCPAADWWALGVLFYECLFGVLPFEGNEEEVKTMLEQYEDEVPLRPYPPLRDEATLDLLQGLLTKDPTQRLGSRVGEDGTIHSHPIAVQSHPYFSGINWEQSEQWWQQEAPLFAKQLCLLEEW